MQIRLPKLHPFQQRIADSKARFKLVVAGRRGGKTYLAVWMAIRVALKKPRAHVFWVAPIYSQTDIGWELLTAMTGPMEGVQIKRAERKIVFPNGSWIVCKSADHPDRLRGFSLDFVVLDEGASMKEEVWFEVLRPALMDRLGEALFIGTPKGQINWFYELWKNAEAKIKAGKNEWALFRFRSFDNPHMPESERIAMEEERERDPAMAAQELDAEFVTRAGKTIKAEWFHAWRTRVIDDQVMWEYGDGHLVHPSNCRIEATVDPAVSKKTTADYFAICAYAVTPTGECLVLDVFQDRILGPDQPKFIINYMHRWQVTKVWIEVVAYQLALFQTLEQKGINVDVLRPKGGKPERVAYLGVRMHSRNIFFPKQADWFLDVELEVTNFPEVAHDDRTDALAYMAEATKPDQRGKTEFGGGGDISLDAMLNADDEIPIGSGKLWIDEGPGALAAVLQVRGPRFTTSAPRYDDGVSLEDLMGS